MSNRVLLVTSLCAAGCDGYVTARFRVLSSDSHAISGAVVLLREYKRHDHAQFTEEDGCGHVRGTISPFDQQVAVEIRKSGYQTLRLDVATGLPDKCFVASLASEAERASSSFKSVELDECPCESGTGNPPTMATRFQVINHDGASVESVQLRESGRDPLPWVDVTDSDGCLGVTWIVPADAASVPLVLEKNGYQSIGVDVPTMVDNCYTVSLSPVGATRASAISVISEEKCACEMFTGETLWLDP